MIIVDVNLLVYAVNRDAPLHDRAKEWLNLVMSGTETVGLPWTVLLAFLRLTTRQGIFPRPLPLTDAFTVVDYWLAQPVVIVAEPTKKHFHHLKNLLIGLGTGGNLTSDAHLAVLAMEHSAELCSTDSDFSRFPGVRWRNPLL